jgi:hypothetical protein
MCPVQTNIHRPLSPTRQKESIKRRGRARIALLR